MGSERLQRWLDASIGIPLSYAVSPLVRPRPAPDAFGRILLIKLAAAGDAVLLVPAIRALRRALPASRIEWLVSAINLPVARTVPYVDDLIVCRSKAPLGLASLARDLRRRNFDAVIDFEQWARGTALLALATRAPIRLGFDTPGQGRTRPFTTALKKEFRNHEVDDFLGLASLLTDIEPDRTLELWETPEGLAEAERLAGSRETSPWVVLHPGCGGDGLPREWPLAGFADLGTWLQRTFHARVFLTSGPEETEKTARLLDLMNGAAIDLGGKLSWPGIISLVKNTDLLVSGNTGIMHVAAAMGRPQVALHGPTDPALWGPINPLARVIRSDCPLCPSLRLGFEYHARDQSCMARIDVETVKSAAAELVQRSRPGR
jgi:ADP-heptose:LPS heptosyltransferase